MVTLKRIVQPDTAGRTVVGFVAALDGNEVAARGHVSFERFRVGRWEHETIFVEPRSHGSGTVAFERDGHNWSDFNELSRSDAGYSTITCGLAATAADERAITFTLVDDYLRRGRVIERGQLTCWYRFRVERWLAGDWDQQAKVGVGVGYVYLHHDIRRTCVARGDDDVLRVNDYAGCARNPATTTRKGWVNVNECGPRSAEREVVKVAQQRIAVCGIREAPTFADRASSRKLISVSTLGARPKRLQCLSGNRTREPNVEDRTLCFGRFHPRSFRRAPRRFGD